MQPIIEVIADAMRGWDGNHGAEIVKATARTLTKAGRFDDLTVALLAFTEQFIAYPAVMRHVKTRIAPIVVSHYLYENAGVSGKTIDNHFSASGMAEAITKAAFREGQLAPTVLAVIEQLRELDKAPVA